MSELIDLRTVSSQVERRGTGGLDDGLLDGLASELAHATGRKTQWSRYSTLGTCGREVEHLRVDAARLAMPWPYQPPRLVGLASVRRVEADLVRLRAELEVEARRGRRKLLASDAAV